MLTSVPLPNQVLHVTGYGTKVPPILISERMCSQASPSDRCTILLSMGSCKIYGQKCSKESGTVVDSFASKEDPGPSSDKTRWIIISPYFPPLKIPFVFELYRF